MPDVKTKTAAVEGALRDRPVPRLLQQLYRKQLTGHFVVTDPTGDESLIYLRSGWPVHVCRPVDTDRLDNLLVEYGLLSAEVVAQASTQVSESQRLGAVLERMGLLDRQKLAQVLKAQVVRKLIRVFFVAEGSYAVYVGNHGYGEGDEFHLMRVDPRTVIYPGIRAAYDLPRVTRELGRLVGQQFRLPDVSPTFVAALGIPADDVTIEALRGGWMTLDDLDSVTSRPLEVRSVALALYYADSLEREAIAPAPTDSFSPETTSPARPLGHYSIVQAGESGPLEENGAASSAEIAKPLDVRTPEPSPATTAPGAASAVPAKPPFPAPAQPAAPVVTKRAVVPNGGAGASAGLSPPRSSIGSKPVVRAAPVVKARAAVASAPDTLRASILELSARVDKSTHFEVLGVSANATSDEVSAAFVRAARQYHPDRLAGTGLADLQPQAERILARINEAVMVLQNPARRAEYVASLSATGPQPAQSVPTVLEAENLFLKGEVFLKKGDHAKAVEAFTAASKGNPEEPQYRAYLAWARFDDPRARKDILVRETLKVLEGVLKERPKFARGFYWVGLLWKLLNESPKAEQAFRAAVQIDSSFIEAGRELRLIEMRRNKAQSKTTEPPRGGGFMGKLWKR